MLLTRQICFTSRCYRFPSYVENPDGWEASLAAFLMFLHTSKIFLNILWRANDKRDSLVNRLRLYIQDCLCPGGSNPSGLLNNESNGVALIKQPEL